MKSFVKKLIEKTGYELRKRPNTIWDDDIEFTTIYRQVVNHTLVDTFRCYMLYQAVKQVSSLKGDIAEVGVYRGGTAKLLCRSSESQNKCVHLFDTFQGMPATDSKKDLHKEGDFSDTSFHQVNEFLRDCRNVKFYPGFFPDTTALVAETAAFCLVHIDVDIYRSMLACCQYFYPRLVEGGIMIFDDYGAPGCPGAKLAVSEFFADKREQPIYLMTGQAILVKL